MKSLLCSMSKVQRLSALGKYSRPLGRKGRNQALALSTLADAVAGGNPMFAHRPVPKIPDGPKDSEGKDDKNGANSEESFMSKYWGYISLSALVLSFSMLYNYFQGYRNRNAAEERIVHSQAIEPIEVNEIRMNSIGLTVGVYNEVTHAVHKAFPEGTCSYNDFISVVLDIFKSRGVQLKGGHLMDRIVETHVVRGAPNSAVSDEQYEQKETKSAREEDSHFDEPLPLGYLLTVLNLALASPAPERVEALFTAARVGELGLTGLAEMEEKARVFESLPKPERQVVNVPEKTFIPSSTGAWEGRKEGYYFGVSSNVHGNKGPGYYRDDYGLELKQAKLDRDWEHRQAAFLREHSVSEVDTISVEEATKAVGYLMHSCQLPGEKLVITTGTKSPAETFRQMAPEELVAKGRRLFSPDPHTNPEFTRAEFASLVLGPYVCAWAECFRNRG